MIKWTPIFKVLFDLNTQADKDPKSTNFTKFHQQMNPRDCFEM